MTADCVVPSLFVRGQNFLKNVVNLEIRERVKSNKLDSFGQALRMTNKVKELINLSTYPLINFKPAFTLAEVLITLGIIGVVAAMTIPTLMATYQKKQTVTRLKRAYSIVQQSIRLSEDENGEVESWNTMLTGDQFFTTYLANHIKYLDKYTSQELWDKAPRKNLNGSAYTGTTYGATSTTTAHFTLLDGSMVSMNWVSHTMWVGIDINGLAKPNTIGKDTFRFVLNKNLKTISEEPSTGDCVNTGEACINKIIEDGWQINYKF